MNLASSNNSDGLGGTGPQGNTKRFSLPGTGTGKSSSLTFPSKKLVKPGFLGSFKWERIFGLRISNSRTIVFFPVSAITAPILVLIKDFPSPLKDEVIRMTGFSILFVMYWRFVRIILNCSAIYFLLFFDTTSVSDCSECPTSP